MCGIVGIATMQPSECPSWLVRGRDALAHRGPDDAGLWWSEDGRVGLAHRRLAIIDVSAAGHQPMRHRHTRTWITFNGEIYNYQELREELRGMGVEFETRSDTEVVLAAYQIWGADCLTRLDGMFALALYNEDNRQLLLARDRAGEKPLYYRRSPGDFRFASELKALMADPALSREMEPEALDCYLAMGFVPGDGCLLRGFHKLPAAHALSYELDSGACQVWRYWRLPDLDPSAGDVDENELVEEFSNVLSGAVDRQMVADVPVGILLSGGVDSSLITAIAAQHRGKIRTFTISFPGHGRFDETAYARLIADYFDTEHTELAATAANADLLPDLVHQFDEPIVDSSMIPTYMVSRLVGERCKVALGGDGGDELFGGYSHHSRALWLDKQLRRIPRPLSTLTARMAGRLLPQGFKGRNWLQACCYDLRTGVPFAARYFDEVHRCELMRRVSRCWPCRAEEVFAARTPIVGDLVQRLTRMDFQDYLAEDILVKVDRASMLCSLEVRAPLLDRRVTEFAFARIPGYLKATSNGRKIFLKKLATRVLPDTFDLRRKQGFSIPLADWLRAGPFRDLHRDVLLDSDCMFDHRAVTRLLAGQEKGYGNSERIFSLLLLELWRREYGVSVMATS